MSAVSNAQIMHKLGSMETELEHGTRSRGVLHKKIEQQTDALNGMADTMSKLNAALEINTEIAVQARDVSRAALENINRFEQAFKYDQLPSITAGETFRKEADPIIRQMKIIRNVIIVLAGMGVFTVGLFFSMAIWARGLLAVIIGYILNTDLPVP